MNSIKNNVKFYECLIDKALSSLNKSTSTDQPKTKKLKKSENLNDLDLVLGIFKLLLFDFEKYSSKWNFIYLVQLINPDTKRPNSSLVKWLGLKISSLLLCLNQEQEKKLFQSHFTPKLLRECTYKIHEIMLKEDNIEFKFNPSEDNIVLKTNFTKLELDWYRLEQDGQENFVQFENRMKINKKDAVISNKKSKNIFIVETTNRNLNKIVMSVITDQSIVIEGDLSTGKTTLVEYLAEETNNSLIKYQMDEFMDSKSLIGNYTCSDIPGEFLWKPGPLYSAVNDGKWLLLEDFDHAPVDSLSLLIDLLETKSIRTSDNLIKMNPNFRIFLTLRPSDTKTNNSNFILSIKKLSRPVILDSLLDQEIVKIICQKYPSFSIASSNTIAEKLLEIYKYLDFSKQIETDTYLEAKLVRDMRYLSLRDLLKVCNRMIGVKNISHRDLLIGLLSDIYECFLCFISNKSLRFEYSVKVGAKLNLNRDEVEGLLFNKKPEFTKKESHIVCGRVKLKLGKKEENLESTNGMKFVYTKSALNLLEKIARCIECNEPVLLCGETGVGKTTALQHLARLLGKKISVINLNQQTETSDLLGSFKPVDIKTQMKLLKEKFIDLFSKYFNVDENKTFLNHIQTCFTSSNWKYLLKLISHATESACKKYQDEKSQNHIYHLWKDLKQQCTKLDENLNDLINKFTFQFFDGKLSQAILNGEWIILDEINLASTETLQFLGSLLDDTESGSSSIILYEKGDHEPLKRHPDFRLFGAMNPASDVGKRNLPSNIRNRFTEIYVDELNDENDLALLIKSYLEYLPDVNISLINSIVNFYKTVRSEIFSKKLSNGTGMPPTYSLRTLCRALKNASINSCNNTIISVFDSLCLSFLTDLNRESSVFLEEFIRECILKSAKIKGKIQRTKPLSEMYLNSVTLKSESLNHICIEDYWVLKGLNECQNDENFIFTKSALDNLKRLARVCSARLPCLIQGDTSIGKTSLIKWLAHATGNKLIRINNHDHTDLAEYIGSYVMDANSNLVFKEGLLVEAMRHGFWILLDELNLASSEVLEALNRVLDDNRELYIPETQEIIKAHPRFLLFATQNPPGKYAGRKQLSRAFRNRFIELHYDELPEDELLIIVEKKCKLPKSYATLLIKAISELKTKRSQVSSIFLGKNSLITLRDLFRWARRYSMAQDLDDGKTDWKQYLAEQGFLLLASRCRSEQDVKTIHACIEKSFSRKIDINSLDRAENLCQPIMSVLNKIIDFSHMQFPNYVWTPSAKRIALLTALAYKFNEPFLLIGETGVGKTTICQILAKLYSKNLNIINCHMHSEASDFLGSMRPVRESDSSQGKLFEWKDGPLVIALKNGEDFLIDEISLADDSVLERLNSVLEEEKTLLLAENITESHNIRANENFRIFATMNPSGDFGKKELSAALRNRFTEIWCPAPKKDSDEFKIILQQTLKIQDLNTKNSCIHIIVEFLRWLGDQTFFKSILSIRDLTQWINFMNKMVTSCPFQLIVHSACLVFIDSFSTDLAYVGLSPRDQCIDFLINLIRSIKPEFEFFKNPKICLQNFDNKIKCGDFYISKGDYMYASNDYDKYSFDSETTSSNLLRVMRCMVMDSPIMLEGSPGVGKTSLIEALGRLTNNKVIRINLSEQTDLNELFGADLPVSDSNTFQQKFEWLDGPFLLALKKGYWVILDEINLASQSVLEGLNSCFDHRNEIFITELNKKFIVDTKRTKIFACQNPFSQGGGRKGLPKSFLNRFAKVYVDKMTHQDLMHISRNIYESIDIDILSKMIEFNTLMNQEVCIEKKWGTLGSPWEFNLRDLFRWCDLMISSRSSNPGDFVFLIYANRFRSTKDKNLVFEKFENLFGSKAYRQESSSLVRLSSTHVQIGQSFMNIDGFSDKQFLNFAFTCTNLKYLESILKCVQMNWMTILVGKSSTGKTSLIRLIASLLGKKLVEISVNNSTDTSDLLGGYEKIKHLKQNLVTICSIIKSEYRKKILQSDKKILPSSLLSEYFDFVFRTKNLMNLDEQESDLINELVALFRQKLEKFNLKDEIGILPKTRSYEKMKFEWIDSALVRAIENGDWVLIDNANFCTPSVLDRLNPLLEKNGHLQINEKGIQKDGKLVEIKQNKNFRLFLSMNEQFGELSRPMRNRGCEIYLTELDPFEDIEDIYIILKTVFPLREAVYSKQLKFVDLFKIYKLAYDYWLIDRDSKSCFEKSLNDYRLTVDNLEYLSSMPTFFTNVNKIKQFKIYHFLFNFSLMENFRQILNLNALKSNDLDLKNVEKYFKSILKMSNYIDLFVKCIPIGSVDEIIKFVELNLCGSFLDRQNLVEFLKQVMQTAQFIHEYKTKLNELEQECKLDLSQETLSFKDNLFLCQNLSACSKLNDCLNLSSIFNLFLKIELSKYRLNFVYNISSDSFYSLLEKNSEMSQFKFLLLSKDFVSLLADSLILYFVNIGKQLPEQTIDLIQSCILLIEKFYLILIVKFDNVLTIAYLKYYWNFIQLKLNEIQCIFLNCWSSEFESIRSIFDQNLYFDDSLFKVYYNLWSKEKECSKIDFLNDRSLMEYFEKISNFIQKYSLSTIMSCRNFIQSINGLLSYHKTPILAHHIETRDSIEVLSNKIDSYSIENIQNQTDLIESLKVVLIKSYPLILENYLHTISNLLLNKTTENRSFLNYASLSEIFSDNLLFDLNSKCSTKNLNLIKSIDYLISLENFDAEVLSSFRPDLGDSLNILSFDFLNSFMPKILLNSNNVIDLTLNFYDLKISLIQQIVEFIWFNYPILSCKSSNVKKIEENLISTVKEKLIFINDQQIQTYLRKKGFNFDFFKLSNLNNPKLDALIYGILLVFLYSPMDPLDPLENDVLIQKNHLCLIDSQNHEAYLIEKNLRSRLKNFPIPEPEETALNLTERFNKPDYYLIKNEIDNCLNQLLNFDLLNKFINLFTGCEYSELGNEQFQVWLNSIEMIITKLKCHFSFYDITCEPIKGFNLVANSLSCLYTEWKSKMQNSHLVHTLIQYPVVHSYEQIAHQVHSSNSDELNLVALFNLLNSAAFNSNNDIIFVQLCDYFKARYFDYKREEDEKDQVESYKYKQYGQDKIEEELETEELDEKFPTFEHNFTEFIQVNTLEDKKEISVKKKDKNLDLFNQVYDLISQIIGGEKISEEVIVNTFYKSYTTGASLLNKGIIMENSNINSLLSHILFTTSINLKFDLKLYDIYHDSNCEQVLVAKKCLDNLRKRIFVILSEWPDNPILIELLKIIKTIETFNLNDPLMKYLTGIDLLLNKSETWQLVASKNVSLEAELKGLNQIVVDWRKLELKQWLNSCETEMDRIKRETSFVWFFNIYSSCQEFLNTRDIDAKNLVLTLSKFLNTSPIGEFFVRIKSVLICYQIFSKFKIECLDKSRIKYLNKILWSIYNFYSCLYSEPIRQEIEKTRAEIDKELKDFINIYKWQDANYWSIKNSIAKSNRHFVRTIKKFKIFLKTEINWEKFTKNLRLKNKQIVKAGFDLVKQQDAYLNKMQKFCSKILLKKFKKNKFNRDCEKFISNISIRFEDLDKESRDLTNRFSSAKKDKQTSDKYKKEFKYLNQEKLKFISDLIKKLQFIGLSYRKGLILSDKFNELEMSILHEKTNNKIIDSDHDFYLTTKLFYLFKSINGTQLSANLPVEKFNGYVHHLYSFIYKQKTNFNGLIENFFSMSCLKAKLDLVSQSHNANFDPNDAQDDDRSSLNYGRLRKLLIQIKLFYQSLNNLTFENWSNKILLDYEHVKDKLYQVIESLPQIESIDRFELFFDKSPVNKVDRELLNELGFLIKKYCQPFWEYYSEIMNDIDKKIDSKKADLMNADKLDENKVDSLIEKTRLKVFKIVENFYKKYLNYEVKNFEIDNCFLDEYWVNFNSDIECFEMEKIFKMLDKSLNYLIQCKVSNFDQIGQKFSKLNSTIEVFSQFVGKYLSYLNDGHLKCCQLMEVLVKVFDEFKQKGLSVPKELEEGDEEGNESNSNENKKFETDDATGLGEGKGSKDVSDQIENEDQLDDAKTKEQREKDEENEEETEKVKEEEKGIEMSEDFEAQMDDVDMEEDEKEENEIEDNEEEDLDDQKGDVDNAMDYLDEQLWDKEEEGEEQQEDDKNEEEPNLDEDIHGGEKLNDDKSDLLAKQEDLPMMDNEENKGDENDETKAPEEEIDNNDLDGKIDKEEDEEQNENMNQDFELNDNPEVSEEQNEEDNQEQDRENEESSIEKNEQEKELDEEESKNQNQNDEGQDEEEKNGDLSENAKNYGSNDQSIEKEKKSKKTNSMRIDENMNESDQEKQDENEADLNEQSKNELSSGQGNNEFNLNSQQRESSENEKKPMRKKNEQRVLDQEQKLDTSLKDLNLVDLDDEQDENNEQETSESKQDHKDFKHLKSEDEKFDQKIYDAATDEQKKRKNETNQDEKMEQDELENPELIDLEDKKDEEMPETKRLKMNKIDTSTQEFSKEKKKTDTNSNENGDKAMESDGDFIQTFNTERPNESTFLTIKENLSVDRNFTRAQVEQDLAKFRELNNETVSAESLKLWLEYEGITQQLSKELCEQLRLILEPTICSKLKGDYKTGKRLNMKRVVEYIATEYRKDKIWLRRTKPNKRDYQVILAVDNSSSMSDNHCMQLAYETIATLTNAFNYLEVGQFGLVSFGEKVEMLHSLNDHFNSDVGARVLSQINFKDDRTKIAEMLDTSVRIFNNSKVSTAPVSKLLIILSDGRGVFYEGIEKVKSSVQNALMAGTFIVFVILDITGKSTSSIYDIKMPVYTPGNPIPTIKSYMENFPFPFYICLREINTLPIIMIEALKQWFEIVTKIDS